MCAIWQPKVGNRIYNNFLWNRINLPSAPVRVHDTCFGLLVLIRCTHRPNDKRWQKFQKKQNPKVVCGKTLKRAQPIGHCQKECLHRAPMTQLLDWNTNWNNNERYRCVYAVKSSWRKETLSLRFRLRWHIFFK